MDKICIMKTLIFVRHGEANYVAESDYKRNLTERGELQAEHTALMLLAHWFVPESVLCSPAVRAKETCRIICRKLNINTDDVQYFPKLYSHGFEAYLNEIIALDGISIAMIVGHNPAISQLVNYFCKDEIFHLEPGASVAISFDADDWNLIFSVPSKILFKSFL